MWELSLFKTDDYGNIIPTSAIPTDESSNPIPVLKALYNGLLASPKVILAPDAQPQPTALAAEQFALFSELMEK